MAAAAAVVASAAAAASALAFLAFLAAALFLATLLSFPMIDGKIGWFVQNE
jgi:Zn-dependent protease